MKKILVLVLFLGFSISAFAVPTCSSYTVQGAEKGLKNKFVTDGSGVQNINTIVPSVKFSCTIDGIQEGERYYYRVFATYPNWLYNTLNVNGQYEHILWIPETMPYVEVTEKDNGKTIEHIWADGLANQNPYKDLAVQFADAFIGFCTDPDDRETCKSIFPNPWVEGYPYIQVFSIYPTIPGNNVTGTLEAPTIPVSYATTSKAKVNIFLIKKDSPKYEALSIDDRFRSIGALIGDELVAQAWEHDQIVEPATEEVEYFEFEEIPSGEYKVLVRYIKEPRIGGFYDPEIYGLLSMNFSEVVFDYNNTTHIAELEIKKLVNSENRLAFECDTRGICNIYDIAGRLMESKPFNKTFEHNKTDKKGMYVYEFKSEDGKQRTVVKTIGK